MAGYKVKVIIPYDYITVFLNMVGQADIEQYQECLAFALSDRWDLDDLEFEVSREAEGHSYTFTPEPMLDDPRCPNDMDFSLALREAIGKYRFFKGGTGIRGMFTPPMTNKLEENGPDESEED